MASDETPKKVVRIPYRPEYVRDLVRRLALDTSNIQWRKHALDRMSERDITDEMALQGLETGLLKRRHPIGEQPDELKLKMVHQIKGRREVGVVVVTVQQVRLRVITVEWEDVR
jgi:hypothetical protein